MPYSPLPFPSNASLENLKVIAQDTTIYIAPGWLGSAGKTGSAGTWTGQTLGNDTTGDGTVSKPFATLAKAWTEAQKYLITGNATLYVQFQKGIYDLNGGTTHDAFFPDNLYHPQGGNIIIQGDPAAVKQKYLWRVANYSWDLSDASHWGHTGDVYLWNTGGTAHGFTGEDEGGYVAISNVSLGSAEYYEDPSVATGATAFRDVRYDTRGEIYGASGGDGVIQVWKNWGNHFFSHQYPHEDGDGIIGLAKIRGASGSADVLGLVFKNANVDLRVPGFYENTPSTHAGRIAPGLSATNSGKFFGVTGAWPESQYSKPNGYYGLTAARNVNYPALPAGVTHVSDEIFTVTNYPVVIRSGITSSAAKPPLVVRGGKIKAIRNLMFTTAAVDGVSAGEQSLTYGLSQLHQDSKTPSPNLLVVDERGEVGVRHIGAAGWNCALKAQRFGAVKAYSSIGIESSATTVGNQHTAGSIWIKADSSANPLDNTPVLMSSLCTNGIVAERNGVVDLSLQSYGAAGVYLTDSTTWMQSVLEGVVSTEDSKVIIGSGWSNNLAALPFFRLIVNIPVFGGSTLGNTGGFYNPEAWNTNTFRDVRLVLGTSTNKNDYIGRVQHVIAGVSFQTNSTQRSGWTGSSWTKSAGFVEAQPLYTQQVTLVGYLLNGERSTPAANNHGIYGRRDIQAWINTSGSYFGAEAYSNEPGSTNIGGLTFTSASMTIKGVNGSYLLGTTAAGQGLSAACFAFDFVANRGGEGRVYNYGGNACSNTRVTNGGSLQVVKHYGVRGGRAGIFVGDGGKLSTRSHMTFLTAMETGEAGLYCGDSTSTAQIGNFFVKNMHPCWFAGDGKASGIYVWNRGTVYHTGNYACTLWPLTSIGGWGAADSSIQNGRLGYYFTGTGINGGEGAGMASSTLVASLETTATNTAERSANAKRNTQGTHALYAETGFFSGAPFSMTNGTGHRVSVRDGRESGRREQIEDSGQGGFPQGAVGVIPVILVSGRSVVSPFWYGPYTSATNSLTAVTTSTVRDAEYSWSHIVDTNITPSAGTAFNTGIRPGTRCEWAGQYSPDRYNTVMKIPAGATAYQWWAHDSLGVMTSNYNTGTRTNINFKIVKSPICMQTKTDTSAVSPFGMAFLKSNYDGMINSNPTTMTATWGRRLGLWSCLEPGDYRVSDTNQQDG